MYTCQYKPYYTKEIKDEISGKTFKRCCYNIKGLREPCHGAMGNVSEILCNLCRKVLKRNNQKMSSKRKAESDNIRNNKKRSISTFLSSKEDDIGNGKDFPKTEGVVYESESSSKKKWLPEQTDWDQESIEKMFPSLNESKTTFDEVLPALPSVLQEDDQCPFCERFFPSAESIRRHITEKHGEHCKLCDIMIEGDFDQHLFDFHYKEKLNNAIPSHVRGCSGKNS